MYIRRKVFSCIGEKCFAGDSVFDSQQPDSANDGSFISKNGKRLSDWREKQDAFNYMEGDGGELLDREFENKPAFKKIKRGGKSIYKIGARIKYDPKKYDPIGPNRTGFVVGTSNKEKVSDVYRDFLKHLKGLDDYGYTTDKESIEKVKKSMKEEIRRQAKEAAIKKKIGTAAVITAGVAGTAYGGKKLYDHYKKDET